VNAFAARLIEEAHARLFDATMTPRDIAATAAFLRTASGKAFAEALRRRSTETSDHDPSLLGRIYEATVAGERDEPTKGMFDDFYDRTHGLPRATLPLAPPPPSSKPR
jgi:hypothetical protein